MAKIAIIINSDTESLEALGKVSNAFVLAREAIENGDDLKIIFEGAGTKWIGNLEKADNKMHPVYTKVKSRITGACQYCSKAFGVSQQIQAAGIPFLAEFEDHPSLRTLIQNGYEVILY